MVVDSVATNMIFAKLPVTDDDAFMAATAERGLLTRTYDGGQTRFVTHLDVSADQAQTAADVIADVLDSL